MATNIQNILNQLEKVKSAGENKWMACCPVHDDNTPSLAISLVEDEKILLHCHAGCNHKDITKALGLNVSDLFSKPQTTKSKTKRNRRICATYDYENWSGQLLYQVLRYSDKSFAHRRPNGEGEWIWNSKDTKKVLYRLPELINADKDCSVFIPEGEKDVDNLYQLGFVATCNPSGAGKWSILDDDCALYNRKIIILPDNDKPGRDHAQDVAQRLSDLCGEIRILELPNLSKGQDVSDWINQQRNKAPDELAGTLQKLAVSAPIWTPEFKFTHDDSPQSDQSASSIEWPKPQPVPDQMPAVMRFNSFLLPESIRPWIEDVADRMQCPADFPAVTAMLALSGIVGRKVAICPKQADNWTVIPNLWGMLVGRPSIMKSPPMKEVLRPLNHLSSDAYSVYKQELKEYHNESKIIAIKEKALSAEMTKLIRNGESTEQIKEQLDQLSGNQPPLRRRYIVNDATVEALGQILAENPNGVLQERDELMGFLKSLERKGQDGSRAFYLEAWNGNGHFETDRIGRGNLCIQGGLCLSMIGTIQPGPLESYIHEAVSGGSGDDGFIQRFQLAVWPDEPENWEIVDRLPNKEARDKAFSVFKLLDQLNPQAIGGKFDPFDENGVPVLRFDKQAQTIFYNWMRSNENRLRSGNEHPALESHFAKYRSMVPSLALLIHLAEPNQGPVNEYALNKALGWEKYLASHARRIYGRGVDPEIWHAQALSERIKSGQVVNGFTLRDVYNNCWSKLQNKHQALIAAEYLEELDWLRSESVTTAGRPRTIYHINPHVLNA